MTTLNEVAADFASFADDDDEVVIEQDGTFAFVRGGETITGTLTATPEGALLVDSGGTRAPYRQFLLRDVAQLHVLAERLLQKRVSSEAYVDGPAVLDAASRGRTFDRSFQLLQLDCSNTSPFATRVVFVTADAGHGKTMLLRRFQQHQAQLFLEGRTPYLFWHVDLQGRQLLRLSEALMGDLADLRIPGIWMPAVTRLIRHHAIVLGIDGFDELAAEQGSNDALGALAVLMRQLEGRGVVVAASRRTFFDTDDYLSRAGMMRRSIASPSEFDQVALLPWTRDEGVGFLTARGVDDPQGTYDEILALLGGDEGHPMLSRPFLLSQVVRALQVYGLTAAEFIRGMDDPLQGVAAVVEAFVQREVSEKWRSKETGEPYLTFPQHMELLAAVADEMYRSQRDRLPLDVIETLAAILLEQWEVDPGRRQQVLSMVKMHVLLTVPPDGPQDVRSFDHTEFRDYFVGYALRDHLRTLATGKPSPELGRFLSSAQISDSTARYVCGMLELSDDEVAVLVSALADAVRSEWKPTYLQTNAGTLLPFLLSGRSFSGLVFDAPAIVSSLALEHTALANVVLRHCTLIRASLAGAQWANVTFENCDLGELTLSESSTFDNVVVRESTVDAVVVTRDGEEIAREYAPNRIRVVLEERGFSFPDLEEQLQLDAPVDSDVLRQLRRFVRLFIKSTTVAEVVVRSRFRQDLPVVFDTIVPLLERHGVIEEIPWHGAGNQRAWAFRVLIDELLAAEDPSSESRLAAVWSEARSL